MLAVVSEEGSPTKDDIKPLLEDELLNEGITGLDEDELSSDDIVPGTGDVDVDPAMAVSATLLI